VCVCVCNIYRYIYIYIYCKHLFAYNTIVLFLLYTTVLHVNIMSKLSLNYSLFQRSALSKVLGNKYNGKMLLKFVSASKADLINKQKNIKGKLLKKIPVSTSISSV
jgi:hypothetical protein